MNLISENSGHVCLCGLTGTGKTSLAFLIVGQLTENGKACFALDENLADWPCPVTDDHEKFFSSVWHYAKKIGAKEVYKKTREPVINVFIDECGEYSLKDWNILKRLLTRGRQHGIRVFLLAQRFCLMSKTSRTQCRTFAIFGQSASDTTEILALTRSQSFAVTADEDFPDLHFVFKSGREKTRFFRINFDRRLKHGAEIVELNEILKVEKTA